MACMRTFSAAFCMTACAGDSSDIASFGLGGGGGPKDEPAESGSTVAVRTFFSCESRAGGRLP